MCLAVPGKVIAIYEEAGLKMGKIDYAGTVSKVCLEFVPEIRVGDYTVVHAGYGISIIDQEEARRSYEAWEDILAASGSAAGETNEDIALIRSLKERASS